MLSCLLDVSSNIHKQGFRLGTAKNCFCINLSWRFFLTPLFRNWKQLRFALNCKIVSGFIFEQNTQQIFIGRRREVAREGNQTYWHHRGYFLQVARKETCDPSQWQNKSAEKLIHAYLTSLKSWGFCNFFPWDDKRGAIIYKQNGILFNLWTKFTFISL